MCVREGLPVPVMFREDGAMAGDACAEGGVCSVVGVIVEDVGFAVALGQA